MSASKKYESNLSFDDDFKSNNISIYPWIGNNYNDTKVLVVGESHYLDFKDNESREKYEATASHTRDVVSDSLHSHFTSNTFKNLVEMFSGKDKELFWDNVAFYNFVDRIMDKEIGTSKNERPKAEDYRNSWSNFIEIAKILKPDLCIFIGVSASDHFKKAITKMKSIIGEVSWCSEPINRTFPRKGYLEVESKKMELVFIKHTSQFISVDPWLNFLKENYSNKIFELKS